MFALGLVVAATGVALFLAALVMTMRANASRPIPFARRPSVSQRGTVAMRGIGAGLIVFGAGLLSAEAWYWPLVCVLTGPGVALVMIIWHNRTIVVADGERH
nr:hypothetical protein [uncultured Microbacterium sp.]